jgi:hypothetical protein
VKKKSEKIYLSAKMLYRVVDKPDFKIKEKGSGVVD